MAKPRNTDGSIDDLGVMITAAYGLDSSWMKRGACYGWGSHRPRQPTPWHIAPSQSVGGISGSELVNYALLICNSCEAQYDCLSYAVEGNMIAGTWSVRITTLRWLQQQDDALELIEDAKEKDVPVQPYMAEVMARRSKKS